MTSAITFMNNAISISTNTTTYTDISSLGNSVKVSAGARGIAEEYFFSSDTAVVQPGKRAPADVEFLIAYTEVATDPFEQYARPAYENHTPIYLRWTPQARNTGAGTISVFTTDAFYVTDIPYPQGDAKADKIITFSLKGRTAYITKSTTTA